MGRSVETHSGAHATVSDAWTEGKVEEYMEYENDMLADEDEPELTWDEAYARFDWAEQWDLYVWDVVADLLDMFPSLSECDEWESYPYRETRFVAENAHTYVAVSEYSGIAQWSLVPKGETRKHQEDDRTDGGLSRRWIDQIRDRFEQKTNFTHPLMPLGRFSDGTTVYKSKGD